MRKRIFTASIIAACGFALSTNAQSAEGTARIGDTKANVNVQTNDDKNDRQDQHAYDTQSSSNVQTRHTSQSNKVQASNKASSIIGMEVVNQNQEALGEIKDVVIDLNSGRVSYAVLGVGGFLGIGEKMVAIPPSAFSATQDDKLTLRADRERLRQAPGFTDENWPDAQNPSWGASSFWKEDSQRNQQQSNQRQDDYDQSGASQKSDSDYEPGRSDTRYNNQNTSQRDRATSANDSSDRDYDNARTALERHDVESDTDYRSTTPNRQVGTARHSDDRSDQSTQQNQQPYDTADRERDNHKIARTELNTARGEIVAIDSEKKTMTVRTNDGQRKEFSFTDIPTINIPGNNHALLVDLKPGYSVRVGYHDDSQGKACAHVITQTGATDIR